MTARNIGATRDSIMYLGIGFLTAGVSLLMVVPFVHGRAVRLTTRRVEDAQPSRAEVLADKDLQRAAFALSMRRLEIKLQEFKDKHAAPAAPRFHVNDPDLFCAAHAAACATKVE